MICVCGHVYTDHENISKCECEHYCENFDPCSITDCDCKHFRAQEFPSPPREALVQFIWNNNRTVNHYLELESMTSVYCKCESRDAEVITIIPKDDIYIQQTSQNETVDPRVTGMLLHAFSHFHFALEPHDDHIKIVMALAPQITPITGTSPHIHLKTNNGWSDPPPHSEKAIENCLCGHKAENHTNVGCMENYTQDGVQVTCGCSAFVPDRRP